MTKEKTILEIDNIKEEELYDDSKKNKRSDESKSKDMIYEKISKDMMINDIITTHPYLAEYIIDLGVHCVGCGIASFETLEEGFSAHGMTDEEIDKAVEELNLVIENTAKQEER